MTQKMLREEQQAKSLPEDQEDKSKNMYNRLAEYFEHEANADLFEVEKGRFMQRFSSCGEVEYRFAEIVFDDWLGKQDLNPLLLRQLKGDYPGGRSIAKVTGLKK